MLKVMIAILPLIVNVICSSGADILIEGRIDAIASRKWLLVTDQWISRSPLTFTEL